MSNPSINLLTTYAGQGCGEPEHLRMFTPATIAVLLSALFRQNMFMGFITAMETVPW